MRQLARVTVTMRDLDLLQCIRCVQADIWFLRLKGFHSIRVNDQWRVVFRWEHGSAFDVAVVDCH